MIMFADSYDFFIRMMTMIVAITTSNAYRMPTSTHNTPTGPPGSGKGTQCASLVNECPSSFLHVSAGELLRRLGNTPLTSLWVVRTVYTHSYGEDYLLYSDFRTASCALCHEYHESEVTKVLVNAEHCESKGLTECKDRLLWAKICQEVLEGMSCVALV